MSTNQTQNQTSQVQSKILELAERYPKTLSILDEYAIGQIDREERESSFRVRIKALNKLVAALAISNCCVAGLALFLGQRNRVQPYVVAVDRDMRIVELGKAVRGNDSLSDKLKRELLKTWIFDTRVVLKEFDAQTNFIFWAMHRTFGPATRELQQWYDGNRPNERAKTEVVTVTVDSILPIPNSKNWEARWTETITQNDQSVIEKWSGIFTLEVLPAASPEEWYRNPTGFHVTDFQWSKTS